jgi:predicted nucleic acid-binding protein
VEVDVPNMTITADEEVLRWARVKAAKENTLRETSSMTAPVFVDTNVLVYSRDMRDAEKHARAREWLEVLWDTKRGRVSPQVLHEYYVTVTLNLRPGLPVAEARSDMRALVHWLVTVDPEALIESAWALQDRCSLSFWDALVVGAAQAMECGFVLTEDLPAGHELEGVLVVNPFATRSADISDPG